MNGVLNIDKPAGMTSHDVVGHIRRLAYLKRVGHAGTLDPDATGILLICLGSATRIADYLADDTKTYRATLALGTTTTTEDASGDVLARADASHLGERDLAEVVPRFVGDTMQIPPMVSAVHHEGKRLYDLARQGITVERSPRTIHIEKITLENFTPGELALAEMEVECGKGTYIRTLCADIGAVLGVGGHMAALRRTRVGAFGLDTAIPLRDLTQGHISDHLVSAASALARFPLQIVISETEREDIRQGRSLVSSLAEVPIVRLVDSTDALLALGRSDGERLYPFKVFSTP